MGIKYNGKELQKRIINGREVQKVMYNWVQIRPSSTPPTPTWWDFYYSEDNWQEYQSLINSIWSVQFEDSWKRFRFTYPVYIWNRTALDFNWYFINIVDLDDFTYTTTTSELNITSRVWYFWDNRILTSKWIFDFSWNVVTTFSTAFNSITPWRTGTVWANNWYDIYKWVVSGDNITFTFVWTSEPDQWPWQMSFGRMWAYLFNGNDTGDTSRHSSYINPSTNEITTITTPEPTNLVPWVWKWSRVQEAVSWPDGNMYRKLTRVYWRWALEKVSDEHEGFVAEDSLSKEWLAYWTRFWKFLWNIVSWGMDRQNSTWNWYWSNNYYITSNGYSIAQTNAFAYDSNVRLDEWFIDEQWYLYPHTSWWWTWVILKTDATFSNLNWANPYLWR